jgi:hypothetical protein
MTMEAPSLIVAMVLAMLPGGAAAPRSAGSQGPVRAREVTVPGGDFKLPAGWLFTHTRDGHCEFMLPAAWHRSGDSLMATSPDGRASLTLSNMPLSSWVAHTIAMKTTLHPFTVYEDSANRLWGSYADASRITEHVSVGAEATLCTADIDMRKESAPALAATTKRIAASVRVARAVDRLSSSAFPH